MSEQRDVAVVESVWLPLLITTILTTAISLFLYRQFQFRSLRRDPNQISSFFNLDDFVSATNLKNYAIFYSGSLSFLFFFVSFLAISSERFVISLQEFIVRELDKSSPFYGVIRSLMDVPQLSLGLGVAIGAFFLYPYIRGPINFCRDTVHNAIGFERTADKIAKSVATEVMLAKSDAAIEFIERAIGRGPRPSELFNSGPDIQASYLILYHACRRAANIGLSAAIEEIATKCGVTAPATPVPRPGVIDVKPAIPAISIFLFLAVVYLAFILLAEMPMTYYLSIEWPKNNWEGRKDLLIEIARISFQIVFPLWIGLSLFYSRWRRLGDEERIRESIVRISSALILLSIFGGIAVLVVNSIRNVETSGTYVAFSSRAILEATLPCVIAPAAVTLWLYLGKFRLQIVGRTMIVAAAGTMLYTTNQLIYDILADYTAPQRYMHALVLGFYLTLVGTMLWALLLRPRERLSIFGRRAEPIVA